MRLAAALTPALLLAAAAAAGPDAAGGFTAEQLTAIYRHSPLPPVAADGTDSLADKRDVATRLGQYLFFDTSMSAGGGLACASCHQPARAFTDGRAVAVGLAVGTRHTPSLLDATYSRWFFWDGRADSLWAQALQPLESPKEMGGDRLAIAHHVAQEPKPAAAYRTLFGPLPPLADESRFPPHARPDQDPDSPAARGWRAMTPADRDAINRLYSNLGKAIEAYERRLVDGNSPFDEFVAGLRSGDRAKQAALSPAARRGLALFVGAGNCELCHSGPAFSDGQFHNLGLPLLPGEAADPGRGAGIALVKADIFNTAGGFSDNPKGEGRQRLEFLPEAKSQLGAFKTPGLRNVALTAPYMHDGRFASLSEVLQFYAQGKAASDGRFVGEREATLDLVPRLSAAQIDDLIAFLQSLNGKPLPEALTGPPSQP